MCLATRDPDWNSHPIPRSWEGVYIPMCMHVTMPLSPGNPGGSGRVLCTRQAVPLLVGSPGGSNKEAVFKGHQRYQSGSREGEHTVSGSRQGCVLFSGSRQEDDMVPHTGEDVVVVPGVPKGSPMSPHPPEAGCTWDGGTVLHMHLMYRNNSNKIIFCWVASQHTPGVPFLSP